MNDNATSMGTIFEKVEDYGKTTIELIKLNAIDKSAEAISSFSVRLAMFIIVALSVLTVNIGLSLWIGELLGKLYYGFFVMAGFYIFVSLVLYIFRTQLIKVPVSNAIITHMLKK